MIERDGEVAYIVGPLVMDSAALVECEGAKALSEGVVCFDFSRVTAADSAGLAVIFSWLRQARGLQRELRLEALPSALANLAAVYDVAELLPASH